MHTSRRALLATTHFVRPRFSTNLQFQSNNNANRLIAVLCAKNPSRRSLHTKNNRQPLPSVAVSHNATKSISKTTITSSFPTCLNNALQARRIPRGPLLSFFHSTPLRWQQVNTTKPPAIDAPESGNITTETQLHQQQQQSKWRLFVDDLKRRKAEYLVQYGSSFIFVHEMAGISSYLIVYSVLSSGLVDLGSVVETLGITEEDLARRGVDLHGKVATFALTVLCVKALDLMGLVPLRWALTLYLTPKVARAIGPSIDRAFAFLRGLFKKTPSTTAATTAAATTTAHSINDKTTTSATTTATHKTTE